MSSEKTQYLNQCHLWLPFDTFLPFLKIHPTERGITSMPTPHTFSMVGGGWGGEGGENCFVKNKISWLRPFSKLSLLTMKNLRTKNLKSFAKLGHHLLQLIVSCSCS